MVAAIFATGPFGEFGTANNGLPFTSKTDMARFQAITKHYRWIIMGKNTFDSIGPLPGRVSIVISKNPEAYRNIENRSNVLWMTLEDALLSYPNGIIIGGAKLLDLAWASVHKVYFSRMNIAELALTYFVPNFSSFRISHTELYPDHTFHIYERV